MSVGALVAQADRALGRGFPRVWVQGEVSNLSLARNGHAFFSLKDDQASLPTVVWASNLRRVRFRLEDGARLQVCGRLGIYGPSGRFQLYAERVEQAGLGELMLELERLKTRLVDEGVIDPERRRPLPPWPRRIGVVTSPQGAAVHDVLKVIRHRCPSRVLIAPARVQGPEAAWELGEAVERLERVSDVEVIIVTRGGGSMEDLWAFNNERLARIIAQARVPVVAAIGHETDVTIADLVADLRAATPSQAAELVVPDRRALADRHRGLAHRLALALRRRLMDARTRSEELRRRVAGAGSELHEAPASDLADLERRLERVARGLGSDARARLAVLTRRLDAAHPARRVRRSRARLAGLDARLRALGSRLGRPERVRLAAAAGKLDAMSPLKVLERGYAVVTHGEGKPLVDSSAVNPGDALQVRLHRGSLEARVESASTDPDEP